MTAAPHPRRRPRGLGSDEILLLSERVLEGLRALDDRIAEQKTALADSAGAERAQARHILRRLQRSADDHYVRLHRLRAGGPTCRACGRHLPVARLEVEPLAVDCDACPDPNPTPRPAEATGAATRGGPR